jgi:hypothetical protein
VEHSDAPSWILLHPAWRLELGRFVLALDLCVTWCISSLTCVFPDGICGKEREGIDASDIGLLSLLRPRRDPLEKKQLFRQSHLRGAV